MTPRSLINIFSSSNLAIAFTALILISSAIGTFVTSERADIYHSWWFVSILSLFSLNLLFCTIKRLRLWRVKPGSSITHTGILIILFGALITCVFAEKGFLIVFKNHSQDTFVKRNGKFKELDFKIRLDDFFVEQDARRVKNFKSKITVLENGSDAIAAIIEVNRPLSYKGYGFYQASYDAEGFRWTGLEVVKDPGAPFVFAGFIVLNAGVILSFYFGQKNKNNGVNTL